MKEKKEVKMVTIPFDVELAKKIQAGEHPGKIVTRGGKDVRVVCFDAKRGFPVICLLKESEWDELLRTHTIEGYYNGKKVESRYDLFLQVPEWIQYKDGDILACEVDNGDGDYCKWFAVLDGSIGFMLGYAYFSSYVSYDYDSSYKAEQLIYRESYNGVDSIRLITENEKNMFIDRLKEENTYKAKDALKRYFGIEDVEEKPKSEVKSEIKSEIKSEFEPFQKVLVRAMKIEKWQAAFFSHYDNGRSFPYVTTGSCSCGYCIPYNEKTKHLVGTTDEWEE